MKHFLLIFDRSRGELLVEQEFADGRAALRARFRAERERSWNGTPVGPDTEVVVLVAESARDLRRTHARYFQTADQILREAAAGLAGS